jgi:hypothetical protein
MGDPKRFDLFASAVEVRHPDRSTRIADVASGKGGLHAALWTRGYKNVTSWDKRKRNAKMRPGFRYGLFDHRNATRDYDLVIGMHPDEATDQIVMYAVKHRKPFLVCPCCIKPTASVFNGSGYDEWVQHLLGLTTDAGGWNIELIDLPMRGRNLVIAGKPSRKESVNQ